MSSKSKRRRAAAACVGTEPSANQFPLARPDQSAPLREVCPALEPWAVDEVVCSDHLLPSHEAIEMRAKEIWASRGRPTDADLEIWLEAQREFLGAAR